MKHAEQVSLNSQLTREISELRQEISLVRGIPQNLLETVTNCKDIYNDVFSVIQVKHSYFFSYKKLTL